MGACRQNRNSENTLNRIIGSVRNIDKLLWNGQKWVMEDLEEYVDCIKRDLDMMMIQFKEELGIVPEICHNKPEVPPTNILGDRDFPCDDLKCGCHKE